MDHSETLAKIKNLSPEDRAALAEQVLQHKKFGAKALWVPNPGPQTEAYHSPADVLLYGGAGGGGKALAITTPLPTPTGWVTMGKVQVGTTLYDEMGQECKVVAATPIMRGRPCYEITFSEGTKIVADAEHQWPVVIKEGASVVRGKHVIKTTEELAAYDLEKLCIIRPKAIRGTATAFPMAPYVFGLWIAAGNPGSTVISGVNDDVLMEVRLRGYQAYFDDGDVIVEGAYNDMFDAGLINNKHIPDTYLRSDINSRIELLRGLMDGGDIPPAPRSGVLTFKTRTKVIADGFRELLASLSIPSRMRTKLDERMSGNKTIYTIKYIPSVQAFSARKYSYSAMSSRNNSIGIKSVVPVKSVPVRCVEVDSPSHQYRAGRGMIQTHNSDLGIGLAFTEHSRSLILRRRYSDIGALIERAIEMNGTKTGYNGTPPPILRTVNQKFIQFGANQHPGDEQTFQGRPYDLKVFDESCHFLESQLQFHLGWLRSSDPNQRCRALLASNPPVDSDGDWLIGMFRPWLDLTHPNPAKPGELRWYVTVDGNANYEVDDADVFLDMDGHPAVLIVDKVLKAQSRSFIPAKLSDNPFLSRTNYAARLDALPEPLRSAIRDGNFMLARKDAEWQVIPTAWIIEAQSRWTKDGHRAEKMTAIAMDPAGGGKDAAELVARHGFWFSEPVSKIGSSTADGSESAALIAKHRRNSADVIIDVGGGYGGAVIVRLSDNNIPYMAFNGANSTNAKTADKQLAFANKRAEAWWRFREALDPDQDGGSVVALPPDPELRSDLAAPTYSVGPRGILIESKDALRARLGRSTGKGDATVMCALAGVGIKKSHGGQSQAGLPSFAKRRGGPLGRKRYRG